MYWLKYENKIGLSSVNYVDFWAKFGYFYENNKKNKILSTKSLISGKKSPVYRIFLKEIFADFSIKYS